MKHLLITVMLLLCIDSFGQMRNYSDIPKSILEQFDEMGLDGSPELNIYESAYFNELFKNALNGFDFTNKKVAFLKANRGKKNKDEYFTEEKERFYRNDETISSCLYIFNAAQKEESGGYDAAIVYWSKRLIPTEEVVKRLKNKH